MLYAQDLAQRVGLNANHLLNALTFSVLLNPLFGLEQRIVGSGLLTKEQFDRAKRDMYFLNCMPPQTEFIATFHCIIACCLIELIKAVQDLLDRKNPPPVLIMTMMTMTTMMMDMCLGTVILTLIRQQRTSINWNHTSATNTAPTN